jgi:hypothetical protein
MPPYAPRPLTIRLAHQFDLRLLASCKYDDHKATPPYLLHNFDYKKTSNKIAIMQICRNKTSAQRWGVTEELSSHHGIASMNEEPSFMQFWLL